jgi:hypothetical protein
MKYLWLFLLMGCSAVKEISTSNHIIQENAMAIIDTRSIAVAHKHAEAILDETKDISGAVGEVADITPWWANLLKYGFISISGIAVVVILWQTGLGTVIRLAVGWLPSRKVNEAKLAVSALDDTDPVTMREYIAVKRSSDPMFNAAWKKEVDNARKKAN